MDTDKRPFTSYQHVTRLGYAEVEGITETGICHIFPKIDGTNASIWLGEDGGLRTGSRRREISIDNDNAGFARHVANHADRYLEYFKEFPDVILFGEWLVPHSLKTYRDGAWRRFYVFDVGIRKPLDELEHEGSDKVEYIPYDKYQPYLHNYGIDYIPLLFSIISPTQDRLIEMAKQNTFLIKDGNGVGEGIVIKNYGYRNQYGRAAWAKIVLNEFKEKHKKEMGVPLETGRNHKVERAIIDEYVTKAEVEKAKAKIEVANNRALEPRDTLDLLNAVYHDLIHENAWDIVSKHNNPVIDFKVLTRMCYKRTKEHMGLIIT